MGLSTKIHDAHTVWCMCVLGGAWDKMFDEWACMGSCHITK